ncbi:high affinity immunoglobulin epsilon receptor subunit beta isoform X3 [Nannospalax galili]|uniref:high affinity immunoglobulin epsilon receptor subunit beta isoform X3 n=1 Tax=Nannospalax galili TaxID=1026970 RepID=UPI00111C722E|nr:high affinity immunoglobulin epsilon receptor subunit beta isoform X3 [Nannospalax galili]
MDTENKSRADLTLPNPQEPSSVPEIELLEVSPREKPLPGKSASPQQQQAWLTVLKKELEFLGFIISGFLSVMSERKNAVYLVRGRLGANIVSSISGGAGIVILILNLSNNSICIDHCKDLYDDDDCYVASFVTELVMMMLFLTILGFCSAVSLTIYGIREELKVNKVAEELLYEELNIYSPIYSELEDKGES